MDRLLILDTETTGLDVTTSKCIEVAAVRYSIKHRCVVESFSALLQSDSNEAEAINHIPAGALVDFGHPSLDAWACVSGLAEMCEVVLAHNAEFDRQWVPPDFDAMLALPWIDTCNGVNWPMQTKPGSGLITLALEHGLGVVDPHRALSDCLLLARLLTRVAELGHDVEALLARGLRPTRIYRAQVSYDDRELAKVAGFKWDSALKQWRRRMAAEDAEALPFAVVAVD